MFDIEEELKKLPEKAGVYLMKDEKNTVIYVGKAKKLKNRVRQYFQSSKNQNLKTKSLVGQIKEFEYIVTDSEVEALLLECNLIKEYSPYYNILLKDDKTYPYIKITTNEQYPRIFITRKVEKDRAKYYGPFTDIYAIREIIDTLYKLFPIRKCKKKFPRDIGKERPCLNHHIGQCVAPCTGNFSEEEYNLFIKDAIDFIEGKHSHISKKMKEEMEIASENLEFEKAVVLRDKLRAIEVISQKQKVNNISVGDADVIAFVRAFDRCLVQVFFIRDGKITGRENFNLQAHEEQTKHEILTAFVTQFYSGTAYIPKEIILQEDLVEEEKELLEQYLFEKRGSKVTFNVPKKGDKYQLVEMAYKNASLIFNQFGEKMEREEKRTKGAMEEIQNALKFSETINRVESYDISHIQGFSSVGSMVVFENGKAKKTDYRKFKIKTVVGVNDYGAMQEVLIRRFNHAIKEKSQGKESSFTRLPDLIFMDGGVIQVNACLEVLKEFQLNIPVCGMVKDDKHRTRALLYNNEEIAMPLTSEGFKLITRIQDEVHRFAISYHRKLHEKNTLHSVLDDIKGIGEKRRKALMKHFGDIEKIKNAEVGDLLEVEEMNIPSAEAVYKFFHNIK